MFNFLEIDVDRRLRTHFRRIVHCQLSRRTLPPIRNRIGCNPEQPSCKRHTPPFKAPKIRQRFVKYFRGKILSRIAIAYPPRDERVHSIEVEFVEFGEPGGIFLGSLDQQTLLRLLRGPPRYRCSNDHRASKYKNCRSPERLRRIIYLMG